MTKQIRSEKAKEILKDQRVELFDEQAGACTYYYDPDDVFDIVVQAESDARDRAVRAFCLSQCGELKCELRSTCHPFKEFKQAYDNE